MRALVVDSFTGPDGVSVAEVPDPPAAEPGSVLVEVRAAALGPWDIGTSHGAFAGGGGSTTFPQVIGWDFTGVRADTGERVAGFVAQPWAGVGAAAPQVVVPEQVLAPVPDGLADDAAATLAVTALTARLALDTAAQPRGANLLVIGAAGAVGAVVVALAAAEGLTVAGPASAADAARVRDAGGTPLDRDRDLAEQYAAAGLISPDAVIDFVGGDAGSAAMALLQDGSTYVSAVPGAVPPATRGIEPRVIGVQPDGAALAALLPRFASGELPVPRFEAVPLADAADAFRRFATGRANGKVVVLP